VAKALIKTPEEFKTVLQALAHDLAHANDHHSLFRRLLEARADTYSKALSQAQTFWSLTYEAHQDSAIFRLCRAYDQEPSALSLKTFVATIASGSPCLPPVAEFHALNANQLAEDAAWVDQKQNRLVKHLMMWRHKHFAHMDVRKTISRSLAAEYPLTNAEVEKLLETGFDIVNRYYGVYYATYYSREMHGASDYQHLLRMLQDWVEGREANLRADIERARRDASED
jgi:hypothetical protein